MDLFQTEICTLSIFTISTTVLMKRLILLIFCFVYRSSCKYAIARGGVRNLSE